MDETRGGSPARRLSQILDPIARLTSDLGSSSAPCSPRLGNRVHVITAAECPSDVTADALRNGPDSPRLLPRRIRQAPAPPPRPKNNNTSPVPYRDSPYVNVPNLVFQKDKSFAETAKSAGYVELKESPTHVKAKCNPYTFTSDPSGHVEYTDKHLYSQIDFELGRGRSPFEAGPSCGRTPFDRSLNLSGRNQHQDPSSRLYHENRLYIDRGGSSTSAGVDADFKKEPRPAYGSSKSFDGYSSSVEELNWQERCLELQLELHRSRSQASRVRDALRDKVEDIEVL